MSKFKPVTIDLRISVPIHCKSKFDMERVDRIGDRLLHLVALEIERMKNEIWREAKP